MGVDDVEPLVAVCASQLARRARVAPRRARLEREELDLEAVDLPQRLDLVADETAEAGASAASRLRW